MNLGNAQMGVLLAVDVFDQFFGELYAIGEFPNDVGDGIEGHLDAPRFRLVTHEGTLKTALHLTGTVQLGQPLDIDVLIELKLELVPRAGEAPALQFVFGDVLETPNDDLIVAFVNNKLNGPDIAEKLQAASIDLVAPMIDKLSQNLFDDGVAPPPDAFSAAVALFAGGDGTVDAIGVFVAEPDTDALPPPGPSDLDELTEIAAVLAKRFLDPIFAVQAAEQVGQVKDGAEIKRLKMEMGDEALMLDGKAEKDGADIHFDGPVDLQLIVGTSYLIADTSKLDVDVDLAWYHYLGMVFAGLLFFVPVLGQILAGFMFSKLFEAGQAPDKMRRAISAALTDAMSALGGGLSMDTGDTPVTLESTTAKADIRNGNLMLFAQAFVATLVEPIIRANYSKRRGKFVGYTLQSGRLFAASELARLVHLGKIIVPGHHDVDGRYMRANPNATGDDNLLARFAPSVYY